MLLLDETLKVLDQLKPKHPIAGITLLMDDLYFQYVDISDEDSVFSKVQEKLSKLRRALDVLSAPVNSIRCTHRLYFHRHHRFLGREAIYSINLRAHPFPNTSPYAQDTSIIMYDGGNYTAPWYR